MKIHYNTRSRGKKKWLDGPLLKSLQGVNWDIAADGRNINSSWKYEVKMYKWKPSLIKPNGLIIEQHKQCFACPGTWCYQKATFRAKPVFNCCVRPKWKWTEHNGCSTECWEQSETLIASDFSSMLNDIVNINNSFCASTRPFCSKRWTKESIVC